MSEIRPPRQPVSHVNVSHIKCHMVTLDMFHILCCLLVGAFIICPSFTCLYCGSETIFERGHVILCFNDIL